MAQPMTGRDSELHHPQQQPHRNLQGGETHDQQARSHQATHCQAARHRHRLSTKETPVIETATTEQRSASTYPTRQPASPAEGVAEQIKAARAALPATSKLDHVLAAQATAQRGVLEGIVPRAMARIAAGQPAEQAVDQLLAQVRAAALAELAARPARLTTAEKPQAQGVGHLVHAFLVYTAHKKERTTWPRLPLDARATFPSTSANPPLSGC